MHKNNNNKKIADLLSLAHGPSQFVTRFKGYICNGYRFHIEDHEKGLKTQNSWVLAVGDNGIDVQNIDFYGVLIEILEFQYLEERWVVLFRYKWWDVYDREKGVIVDEHEKENIKGLKLHLISISIEFVILIFNWFSFCSYMWW